MVAGQAGVLPDTTGPSVAYGARPGLNKSARHIRRTTSPNSGITFGANERSDLTNL
jgi:hypothetical protein